MPAYLAVLIFFLILPSLPATAAEKDANAIFLVAKREMRDARFRETVVLVTQPLQGGPWGVIVNRPLETRLAEIFTDHESVKKSKDVLYFGGPVMPDGLVFLVRAAKPPPRSVPVLKDVYFTGDVDWIDEQLKRPDPTRGLRVYAGYAGWGEGQLQNEIARGDWLVVPADAATVFDKDPVLVWPALIQRATGKQAERDEELRFKAQGTRFKDVRSLVSCSL
jgi:putative transcriptional regulator